MLMRGESYPGEFDLAYRMFCCAFWPTTTTQLLVPAAIDLVDNPWWQTVVWPTLEGASPVKWVLEPTVMECLA